ncbi:MAG: hypothetical protein ACK4VW_09250 [Anaerolineales bacterium]
MLKKILLLSSMVTLLLAGCGGQKTSSNEVTITLTDFGIQSSVTEFKVGVPYRFTVTNAGKVPHEFMIMPPLTAEQMSMHMEMEELDKMALAMIGEEDLPPGATKSFEYTFTQPAPAGTLEFACHVSGHYEAGMKLGITVR